MPTIISLVKDGELELTALDENGDPIADGGVLPACQVINVRIEPNNDGESAADEELTLGGCVIPADPSSDSSYDSLTGAIVADHNVNLLTAWSWKFSKKGGNQGSGRASFKFTPRLDPSSEVEGSSYTAEAMTFEGVIIVSRLVVGGEIGTRNDIDFAYDIVEYTSLPVPYGGQAPPFTKLQKKNDD